MRRSTRLSNQNSRIPSKLEVKGLREPEPEPEESENEEVEEEVVDNFPSDEEVVYEENEAEVEEDAVMLSDDSLSNELKKGKKRRIQPSMSLGVAPIKHSRLNESTKNFKFRSSAVTNKKTKVFNIHEYAEAVKKGYIEFCQTLASEGIVSVISKCEPNEWIEEEPDETNLNKWLNRTSVRLDIQTELHDCQPKTSDVIFEDENDNRLNIFKSEVFEYKLNEKKHELKTVNVNEILKLKNLKKTDSLAEKLKEIEANYDLRNKHCQALFCGGPISVIKSCPQKSKDGLNVVAIVTVADEILWKHDLETPSYIQFWKYDGNNLSKNAQLWFLLKIKNIGTIADITWCPLFTEDILKVTKYRGKVDTNLLGQLAVTTDCGKIMIYRIDKNMPKSSSNIPIYSTEPLIVLKQPTLTLKDIGDDLVYEDENDPENLTKNETPDASKTSKKISKNTPKNVSKKRKSKRMKNQNEDGDEEVEIINEEDIIDEIFTERQVTNAPFVQVYWSPYDSGKYVLGLSATGWVLIWDLSTKDPENAVDWLYDDSWDCPPTSAALIGNNVLVVSFPLCKLAYYDMDTKTRIHEDSSARAIGVSLHTEQMTFPGTFTYDIIKVIPEPDGQQYFCSSYQRLDLTHNTGLLMQPLNKHVGQCLHLSVCPLSGIVGTVGMDGRLVESLTGRLAPRGSTKDYACSNHRPKLQLIRKTKQISQSLKDIMNALDVEENKKEETKLADKPLIEYDDIINNSWLEVRLGDAALIDQVNSNISNVFVEKATYARRLETLMKIDFNRHHPGISLTGGEAGILFIIPTNL